MTSRTTAQRPAGGNRTICFSWRSFQESDVSETSDALGCSDEAGLAVRAVRPRLPSLADFEPDSSMQADRAAVANTRTTRTAAERTRERAAPMLYVSFCA